MNNPKQAEIDRLTKHYRTNHQPDLEQGLARLHERIGPTTPVRTRRFYWLAVAAAGVLLLVAGWFVFGLGNTSSTYLADDGPLDIDLPDGSRVVLQTGSELRLASDFNEQDRHIELTGVAYFEIAEDTRRPFLLRDDDVEMRVVGTAFDLKHDEQGMVVEVSEGMVRLTNRQQTIQVAPRQKGTASHHSDRLRVEEAPYLNGHAWRTGRLQFQETPLREVLADIASAYRIDWEIPADLLASCGHLTMTGSYDNEPIDQILESLKRQFSLEIEPGDSRQIYRLGSACR